MILGLLPDVAGNGALVGCWECGTNRLAHITEDGIVTPHPDVPGEAIGLKNALLRDMRANIWLATNRGLFVREPHKGRVTPVKRPDNNKILEISAILEHARQIWLAAADGLWVTPNRDTMPRKLDTPPNGTSLALARGGRTHELRVWLGGDKDTLLAFNPESLESENYGAELQRAAGRSTDVLDVEADDDDLLVATKHGLFRLSDGKASRIALDADSQATAVEFVTLLRRLKDGRLLAISRVNSHSRLWLRPRPRDNFSLVDGTPFVSSIAETAGGKVLLGTTNGVVLALSADNRLTRLWNLHLGRSRSIGPALGICSLSPDETLLMHGDLRSVVVNNESTYDVHLPELLPWNSCVAIDRNHFLLQHATSVSLLEREGGAFHRKEVPFVSPSMPRRYRLVVQRVSRSKEGPHGDIVAIADGQLWLFKRDAVEFRPLSPLPLVLASDTGDLATAVGGGHVWLGTKGSGLWAYAPDAQRLPGWRRWDERDGLSSSNVEDLAVTSDGALLISTRTAVQRAVLGENTLSFTHVARPGIRGETARMATWLEFDGRHMLAVATELGVSLVHVDGSGKSSSPGPSQISLDDGLLGKDIHVLVWRPPCYLWVGSNEGVSVFRLQANPDGTVSGRLQQTLTEAQGLPRGQVKQIRFGSSETDDVWLHTSDESTERIHRWNRKTGHVVSSDPILLAGSSEVTLGPSEDGRAPGVLLRDKSGHVGLWSPKGHLRPTIVPSSNLLWIGAEVELGALDPSDNHETWTMRYALDALETGTSSSPYFWPPDLFDNTTSHSVLAEITRAKPDGTPLRYVVAAPVPRLARGLWVARLIIFAAVFLGPLGLVVQRGLKWRQRRAWLSRKFIPYIQGEAIQDAANFIGRQSIMSMVRNTVATTNYALIGEFRIGKTSIQRQLSLQLELLVDPHHVYVPVYVDLQHLQDDAGSTFFHFLGKQVIEVVRKRKVPAAMLAELEHGQTQVPASYDSLAFQNDLELLLDALDAQHAPKKTILVIQIDEVMLMKLFQSGVLLGFRAVFVNQPQVKTVLTGPALPKDQPQAHLSPWWNFLREIEVEPLTPSEARELVTHPVDGLFKYSEEAIDHIIGRAQGRPLELQKTCASILHYKYDTRRLQRRITLDDVYAALQHSAKQRESNPQEHS